MSPNLTASAYPQLLALVRKTLVEGQANIEAERVRIYWQTGKHIYEHILKHQDRAEYGAQLFRRLEKDLQTHHRLLERCVQFTKTYPRLPIASARTQFKWSHYRELIAISDPKKRFAVEKEAIENDWTSRELASRIRNRQSLPAPIAQKPAADDPLTPSCGTPYTYQVVQRMNLKTGKSALRLDLGFGVFLNDEGLLGSLMPGEIVESRKKETDTYKLTKDTRLPKDLYTYWAEIEKVIDGDTVKVRFDLGFNTEIRQTLRLRGLDCAEMDTKEGQDAKTFCQSYLKEEAFVIVHTKRSDKYDRYLADIFIPMDLSSHPTGAYRPNALIGDPLPKTVIATEDEMSEGVPRPSGRGRGSKANEATSFETRDDILKNSLYLNNLLLKEGYAERWEG